MPRKATMTGGPSLRFYSTLDVEQTCVQSVCYASKTSGFFALGVPDVGRKGVLGTFQLRLGQTDRPVSNAMAPGDCDMKEAKYGRHPCITPITGHVDGEL